MSFIIYAYLLVENAYWNATCLLKPKLSVVDGNISFRQFIQMYNKKKIKVPPKINKIGRVFQKVIFLLDQVTRVD